ncbi:low-density lipoprotein receptor-related protein 2-like [Saccostrea cucullata]|uniref:low-density lipoprotein receptor-related protein 2-like n=1 Tax=Saccostrea cuccullata TaxID=36930 RepID=UPI002ECFC870
MRSEADMNSIWIVCCVLISQSLAYKTYYLDENCGKTLDVDTYFRLQASRKTNLQSGLNCTVDLFARSGKIGGSARILARFLNINMPFSSAVSGCDRVKLELHDGIRNATLLTPPNGLCGDSFYNTYSYVTVKDSFMTFTLTTNPSPQTGSFDAIITNFHEVEGDDKCLNNWWKCGNGRCVDPSTKCNSFDNCGDNTDETYEKCKPTMYFYENCGQEIHVYDAVHLKLKRSGNMLIPNTVCDNIVVAHGKSQGIGQPAQVYAHFRSIGLPQPVSGNCTSARIDVYDGLRNKKRISDGEGLCGTALSKSDFSTESDNFMPIEFTTDSTSQQGNFEITLTSFHTGDCISGEFRCRNGRCVDTTVQCDGYQNCGDNSDNDSELCDIVTALATGAIVAIVLSAIFLVIFVPICCIVLIGRRRRSNYSGI